jgi:predicted ArsR family transcriptional regulator
MTTATVETARHRALADPRRAAIVAELEQAPEGLGASELGRRLGLHANTIRWHLGILGDADLVRADPEPRSRPGRPRILYSLGAGAPRRGGGDDYRLLATVLADTLSRETDGEEACERAGRAWGSDLVQGRGRAAGNDVGAIAGILADQGFEPEVDALGITMRRCPFLDLAEANPRVVCAVHRGLIDGALRELGVPLTVSKLEIFPRPNVCVAHLASVQG